MDEKIPVEYSEDGGQRWRTAHVPPTAPVIGWLNNYGSPFETAGLTYRWPACHVEAVPA